MSDVLDEVAMDEPTDVGADAGAVEEADASGVADVSTPEVPEAATPAWTPSQEEFAALQQSVAQIAQQFQPQPEVQQAPQFLQQDPDTGEYGIDPNALQQYIDWQVQQGVQSRIGAYEPALNQTVADRGEQVISQHLETLKGKVGDFDPAIAREIAEGLAARPGADPYRALEEGARRANAFLTQVKQQAVEEYKQQLSNIGEARPDGPAAGSAIQGFEPKRDSQGRIKYDDVVDNWVARRGL